MGPHRSALLVLAVLAALALCCAAPALALQPAGNGWYWQLPQPQGQLLNSVTMPDAQDAWAVGNGGVIMHSTDGGASWVSQTSPTTDPLAGVTFTDAQHGCAVGGVNWDADIYGAPPLAAPVIVYTGDGGATWQAASAPGQYPLAAVSFVGQDGWAVGKRGTILHSSDGGATWARQRSGVVRGLMAVTFTDAQHGFAAGAGGVLVKTLDGGLTWTRVKGSGDFFWSDCNALAMDGAGTLWASMGARHEGGEFDRLLRSADGGLHWRSVDVGWDYHIWNVTTSGTRIVGVGPVDEGSAAGTSRIVISDDGGATWSTKVLGQDAELTAVAIGSHQSLCAVGGGTVWSADGGVQWSGLGLPVRGAGSLDFVSATQGWAAGSGSLFGLMSWFGGAGGGSVLHTGDGATWQEQLSEPNRTFSGVDFADAQHGWAVGSGGAIRSSQDGGATWTKQASGTTAYLTQVDATGAGTAWAMGFRMNRRSGGSPVMVRTTDAGAQWLPVTVPAKTFPVAMQGLSGTDLWIAGWGSKVGLALEHTTDGGVNWTDSTVPAAYARYVPVALDFVDAQHGWVVATPNGPDDLASVVLSTSDGGQTWTSAVTGDPFTGVLLTAVDFVDAQHGWVAGDSIFATSDGGATWTKVVNGLGWVAGLAAVDQTHVWAGADGGGIVSTVDAAGDTAPPTTLSEGARGWLREPTHLALTASDTGGSGVATTEYSLDGGAWQPYLAPLDFPAPADHSGDGSHTVRYRSTDKGGLVEPVQSCVVRTDTVRPVVRLRPSVVGRDGVVRLRARIDDASTTYVDQFEFRIYRDGMKGGSGWDGLRWATNRWRTFRDRDTFFYRRFAPGWYHIRMYATDPAGNKQIVVGKSMLLIKRHPGKRAGTEPMTGSTRHVFAPRAAAAGWMPAEVRQVLARSAKQLH